MTAERVELLTPPATIRDSSRDSSDSAVGPSVASMELAVLSACGFHDAVMPGSRLAARLKEKFMRSTKAPVLTHVEDCQL